MKLFKNRCYNGGNKHNFETIYEEKEADWSKRLMSFERLDRSVIFYDVFVCFVCRWCGKVRTDADANGGVNETPNHQKII